MKPRKSPRPGDLKAATILQVVVWHDADDQAALNAVQGLMDYAVSNEEIVGWASEDCPNIEVCAFAVKSGDPGGY